MTKKYRSYASSSRSAAQALTSAAEEAVTRAWRNLAEAGAPRVSRADRQRRIETAERLHDQARAHFVGARSSYAALTGEVKRAEEEKRADRSYYAQGANPAEKAGVTILQPQVRSLTQDLAALGECLRRHTGSWTRTGREEIAAADRLQPLFSRSDLYRCGWCGKPEGNYSTHYALDAAGYACRREEAKRFCCHSCFRAGKDLEEPAPPPRPEGHEVKLPEEVRCEVVTPPALSAHTPPGGAVALATTRALVSSAAEGAA